MNKLRAEILLLISMNKLRAEEILLLIRLGYLDNLLYRGRMVAVAGVAANGNLFICNSDQPGLQGLELVEQSAIEVSNHNLRKGTN